MKPVLDVERVVLKSVFMAGEGLHLYTLHTRLKITPGMLANVIKSLERRGLVRRDHERVFLTDEGRQFGHNARFDLFANTEKPWRQVPDEFKAPVRDIKSPYVPFKDTVHWSLLPKSRLKK